MHHTGSPNVTYIEIIGKITKYHICKQYPNKIGIGPNLHTLEIVQVLKLRRDLSYITGIINFGTVVKTTIY